MISEPIFLFEAANSEVSSYFTLHISVSLRSINSLSEQAGIETAGGVGGEDSYKMYLILGQHTLFQVDVTHKG